MTSHTVPKMSLVAQYDDLCRYTRVLTAGCEEEFRTFVIGQQNLVRKWKEHQAELIALKAQVSALEAEKNRFECQVKHMKNLLEGEIVKRKTLQMQKDSMERQIALIKEVLLADGTAIDNQTKEKLFLLSNNTTYKQPGDTHNKLTTIEESIGSLLSDSEVDVTEEDFDFNISRRRKPRSKGAKRSSGERDRHHKRKKSENRISSENKENGFGTELDTTPEKKDTNIRSSSEPNASSFEMPTPRVVHRSDSEQIKSHTYDARIRQSGTLGHTQGGTPIGRYSTGGKLSRTHAFVSKTVIRTEKCYPCGKVIKFCKQALKCSDCRITCHPECKEQCPLPCIPVTYTPTKGNMGTIADYTSSTSPMIPSLIVHCINEIESRGFKEIGLYRISGSEREVKDLKDKLLKGRNVVSLNQADIHAICGTVKEFLRSLKDSLITRAAWKVFVEAAENKDETMSLNLVYDSVCDLPQPNRDTLAFLILHLQRVAKSPDCRMPLENLAKVFGPTIVGYSSAEPLDSNMLTETRQQCQVMQCLLKIPADLWQAILNIEPPEVFINPHTTPETLPEPKVSRLGPIYPSSGQKNVNVGRTALTPRHQRYGSKTERRQFLSPLLK